MKAAAWNATAPSPPRANFGWTRSSSFSNVPRTNHYFDTDQFEKSIQAYEQALALEPNNANVLTDMGVMYRRSDQPQKAIAAFDKAIAVDPGHEISRFNKGIVLMHDLNDREGAVKAWADLVRINPLAKTPSGIPIKEMVDKLKQSGS